VDGEDGNPRLMNPFEVAKIDPMVGLGKLSINEKGTSKQMTLG
jgi:hypothetical protein